MSLVLPAGGRKYDSAEDILAAWDPSGDGDRLDSSSLRTGTPRGHATPSSFEDLQAFEIPEDDESFPDGPTVLYRAAGPGRPAARGEDSPAEAEQAGAAADGRPEGRPALPRAGDTLGGFRLVHELGRGAFARVFLAEEMNLGRRLVALKISRAEGDEPLILARLQHAHIVPVHSVHDDAATGMRFLCMPFFGGANLARLLQETWGLAQDQATGRSLVEALDQFSQGLPAVAGRESLPSLGAHRRSRERPDLDDAPRDPMTPARDSLRGSFGTSTSFWRIRSLVDRLVPWRDAPRWLDDPDEGFPSRRFLREADGIRASVWIVARLAEGLDHAHSRGLLHRDLKPANILIAADGTPMLLDFNLAAEAEPVSSSSEVEICRAMIGGTLPYMSPEHLDAVDPEGKTSPLAVDERSDLYALGLILFELVSGSHPFSEPDEGVTPVETIRAMIAERRRTPVPSLRARRREVPWSLDALVSQCLQPDPRERYASARDLADDLRRFLDDLPMKHCPEPSLKERLGKWARRHPAVCGSTSIALISLLLLVLAGGAAYVVYDAMLGVSARIKLQRFDRQFADTQFLLNVAARREEWTRRGESQALHALRQVGLADRNPGALPGGVSAWVERLSPQEQRRVRRQAVELILLSTRVEVRRANRMSDEDRRKALEHAIARLDRAEHIDPDVPAALLRDRARYHAALGDAEPALRDLARVEQQPPRDERDLTLMGTSLLASGDVPAAEAALRTAVARDPTSLWAWFALGHCYFEQGRFLESAGAFSAAVARGPSYAWLHFNRALALARAGRPLEAADAYDRAVELDPGLIEARVDRGLVELELNLPEKAAADFRAAIDAGRKEPGILAAYGEALARLGRTDEAERMFADLLRTRPRDPVVLVARGMTRLRTDCERAREDFATVLLEHPGDPMAHYGMARVVRGKDHRQAIAHLDTALEADPNLIDALQLRALERARLGERATLDDVELLLKAPTARRTFNAACALAVYSHRAGEPRALDRAMQVLELALRSGFPAQEAAGDPDLDPLKTRPEFARLLRSSGPSLP
jgi:serine/threonine protein kinase/tetratricopeptide (TPR) repeat protein